MFYVCNILLRYYVKRLIESLITVLFQRNQTNPLTMKKLQRQLFSSLKRILALKMKLRAEENVVLKREPSIIDHIETIEAISF